MTRDPIAILEESNIGRIPELIPLRWQRMSESAFTFYRGAASLFAFDLFKEPRNTQELVQACGDCHLANFGVFATPERRLVFDVNDFDETTRAPWEWDIKRLVASFVIAGQDFEFKPKDCRKAAYAAAHSYRRHMAKYADMTPLEIWYSRVDVAELLERYKSVASAAERKRIRKEIDNAFEPHDPKLVDGDRFRDDPPLIYHPTTKEGVEIVSHLREAFERYGETLSDERWALLNRYEVVDAAVKVVGVGSVGTRCGVLLLKNINADDLLILQVKEARRSVISTKPVDDYENEAERVVVGQRMMQAASDVFLGWSSVGPFHFYVRQLRDVKIKPQIEKYSPKMMNAYATACGWALARAHARTGFPAIIKKIINYRVDFECSLVKYGEDYSGINFADYSAFRAAIAKGDLKAA